jgi:hypothetical protein
MLLLQKYMLKMQNVREKISRIFVRFRNALLLLYRAIIVPKHIRGISYQHLSSVFTGYSNISIDRLVPTLKDGGRRVFQVWGNLHNQAAYAYIEIIGLSA